MARRRTRTTGRRTKRRGWIPKLLLLLGYGGVAVGLIALFVMHKELRRFGIFGAETAPARAARPAVPAPPVPRPLSPPGEKEGGATAPARPGSPQVASSAKQEPPPAETHEHHTESEKKQLDDILRAKGGR